MAAILAQQLGCPVVAEEMSIAIWEKGVRTSGMGEYQVSTLVKMFKYYAEFGFCGNTQVLSWLLKRPATSFEAFVKRAIRARLQAAQ